MQDTNAPHLRTLRQQCDILYALASDAIKDAGFDQNDRTYSALIAGYCALQRELHHEERGAALLHSLQATAGQPETA